MKTNIIDGAIELDLEPHDIMDIPAASLWELCRRFDAEMGKSLKGIYSGLCVYEYFKRITKDAAKGEHTDTGEDIEIPRNAGIMKVANYEDTIKDAFKKKCISIAEILDIGSEIEDIGH